MNITVCMKFTKALMSTLHCVVHYKVMLSSASRYAVSHNYVRIPAYISIFTLSQYI